MRTHLILFWLLITVLLTAAPPTDAQQPKTIPRIGYLSNSDAATGNPRFEPIRLALRELGYLEGQNIAFEYRYLQGKIERVPAFVADLVRLKVDILVLAGGILPLRAAKNATKTIPIIMTGQGLDPVEAGLVESLARPGGNITGPTTSFSGELDGKRLELLKEAVPKITRVAVFYDPINPSSGRALKTILPNSARALKLTLQPAEIRTADDFERVFAAVNKERSDGLQVLGGGLMSSNQKRFSDFALKNRLPSIYQSKETVDGGGLMSYSADIAESNRLVASYIDKIIKGAKPADLPIQQPTKFELTFNLKTAKQIGVTIPQSLLYRANKVIR
jgi:putative tryptophan/tyrosine transport system substrate-binding protein